jgi:hypothetical protein
MFVDLHTLLLPVFINLRTLVLLHPQRRDELIAFIAPAAATEFPIIGSFH